MTSTVWALLRRVPMYWRVLVIVLTPLVLLPIPLVLKDSLEPPEEFDPVKMANCAYIVAIMAVYWVTEAFPLPVTAFLPLFGLSLLKVIPAKEVAKFYIHDLSFLFIGGLTFGAAVEETNLHRLIALRILLLVGSQPRWLLVGIMSSSAFLSMWVSNTATTAMMVPVVMALAKELIRAQRQDRRLSQVTEKDDPEIATPIASSPTDKDELDVKKMSTSEKRFCKCLLLSVCYSASLGGTATLTGSLPNVVMTGILDKEYGTGHPVNYASWMGFNLPGMFINLTVAWLWLQLLFFGPRALFSCKSVGKNERFTQILHKELDTLGPISFGQLSVIGLFLVLLFLWLTRDFLWGSLFISIESIVHCGKVSEKQVSYVSDATSAVLMMTFLFIWPKDKPDFKNMFTLDPTRRPVVRNPILTWQAVEKKLPWGIVFLLSGGLAVGGAISKVGLSQLIGNQLAKINLNSSGLLIVSLVIMTYTTEFTSNTATSSLILPIIIKLAEERCLNPLFLALPTAKSASFAFMLPVATPPNAIVFTANVLRVTDMILVGFFMNIFCMMEVMLSIHAWGFAMFNLGEYPAWAGNNTLCNMTAARVW